MLLVKSIEQLGSNLLFVWKKRLTIEEKRLFASDKPWYVHVHGFTGFSCNHKKGSDKSGGSHLSDQW